MVEVAVPGTWWVFGVGCVIAIFAFEQMVILGKQKEVLKQIRDILEEKQ
tara:strand:- start:690 stop:836 length:147 start_codon:yes stop_codon:yes gene_type:complete